MTPHIPPERTEHTEPPGRKKLGNIIRGSLLEGLEMKLDAARHIEDLKAGKFIVVEGEKYDFFSMITDLRLAASNDDILSDPPKLALAKSPAADLMRAVMKGNSTYSVISLRPMLMMGREGEDLPIDDFQPKPVKTVPAHFARVAESNDADIAKVFGSEAENIPNGRKNFFIGNPLDMTEAVCIDLKRFAERSSAIFGRTGTGKTFITRLILAGLIKTDAAVNLVFDMHNEYGTKGTNEGAGSKSVKGLQPLFAASGKVKIYSLDPDSTRNRGAACDVEVRIGTDQIEPDDILLLQEELRLNPTAAEYTHILKSNFRDNWLAEFLKLMSQGSEVINEFAENNRLLSGSMDALYRRVKRLVEQCKFLDLKPDGKINVVDRLVEDLERGTSVVIEFGKYDNLMSYLLVANLITRQIEERYKEKTEVYLRTQLPQDEPKQLVITVEEAHKFLNPRAAAQTSFGKIARELRKYYVSLLIVDQRPSGIYDEILSQIGTKIVAALSDEKDINAVLNGVSNPQSMRNVLASLDTKQQALVLGHAVPMPVVIRTRNYDESFYSDMGFVDGAAKVKKVSRNVDAMFPED